MKIQNRILREPDTEDLFDCTPLEIAQAQRIRELEFQIKIMKGGNERFSTTDSSSELTPISCEIQPSIKQPFTQLELLAEGKAFMNQYGAFQMNVVNKKGNFNYSYGTYVPIGSLNRNFKNNHVYGALVNLHRNMLFHLSKEISFE